MVFKKIRDWTVRVLDCLGGGNGELAAPSIHLVDSSLEPREIPRPYRYPPLDIPSGARWCETGDQCSCHNCLTLAASVGECPICLGALSGRGVATCSACSNITCTSCSSRLHACPYCRHAPPPTRNTALERIIANLHINSPRWSDKKECEGESSNCVHWRCPIKRGCAWRGAVNQVTDHLTEGHSVAVLGGAGITVEIAGFRAKVAQSVNKERRYVVALACHNSLFLVKVALRERALAVVFVELTETQGHDRFGAWLEVTSPYRNMKGIMPVSTKPNKYRELMISCESLMSPWKVSEDTVRIDITIRPLS